MFGRNAGLRHGVLRPVQHHAVLEAGAPQPKIHPLKNFLDVRRQLSYCSMTVKDGHDFSD
jgi:hypothetical protein